MWAGTSTFRVGDWELGVRCSRPDVHDVLRRALAAHLVEPDDSPASPNFSLHVTDDPGDGGPRDLHQLYRGVTSVIRTRHVRRLVDGLLGYLASIAEQPDAGVLRLDAVALVRDGMAVLIPAEIRSSMATIERRLDAKGVRVVDRPWACVDVERRELVVAEPALTVDAPVLDELGTDGGVAAGRYPLVGWGFGVGRDEQGRISRAVAVTLAGARLVDHTGPDPQVTLDALARLVAGVEPGALWGERTQDLVRPIVALFG